MRDGAPTQISPRTCAFINRMAAAFGAPETALASEFKRLLDEKVGHYSQAVLIETADHFIENRKSWPKIADVMAIAREREALREAAALAPEPPARDPWSADALARADALMRCDLGKRAVAEGWAGQLWDFTRAHGRLPKAPQEIGRLIACAREHAEQKTFVRSGSIDGRLGHALARLADGLEAHDRELAGRIG